MTKPTHSPATERLTVALVDMASNGDRPPCAVDPTTTRWWTSEDAGEREAAAHRCAGCPIIRQCRDAADEHAERHHVWAGVDRTPTTKTRRTK